MIAARKQNGVIAAIEGVVQSAGYIAMAGCLVMALVTTADVMGRFLFSKPLMGSYEFNEYLQVLVTFMGLAFTQSRGGHVRTEIALSRLSPRLRNSIYVFIVLPIILGLFCLMTWKSGEASYDSWQQGEFRLGGIPWFPVWPVRVVVALGCFLICVQILLELFGNFRKLRSEGGNL